MSLLLIRLLEKSHVHRNKLSVTGFSLGTSLLGYNYFRDCKEKNKPLNAKEFIIVTSSGGISGLIVLRYAPITIPIICASAFQVFYMNSFFSD